MVIQTWIILFATTLLSLIIGVYGISYSNRRLNETRAITMMLLAYGLISTAIIVTTYFVWHIHSVRRFIIHNHPVGGLTGTIVVEFYNIHIDLLSIIVYSLTILTFFISFLIGQISLHILAYRLQNNTLEESSIQIKSRYQWLKNHKLIVIRESSPDAFTFTLLKLHIKSINIEDWLVLTTGLIELTNDDELEAVLAHEYSHTLEHDTRYSHLIFTLAAILFFDPILKFTKYFLHKKHELNADLQSVKLVNKPLSLARALFKMMKIGGSNISRVTAVGIIGKNEPLILERIKRLIKYANDHQINI